MNRRNFLKGLLATASAVALAPVVKATEQGPRAETVLPEPENDLREVYEACKHGSLMRLDNLGVRMPGSGSDWVWPGAPEKQAEATGRLMLATFDQWTDEHGIAVADAAPYRDAIAGEYGLRREQWAGWAQDDPGGMLERLGLIPCSDTVLEFGEPYQNLGRGGPIEITIRGASADAGVIDRLVCEVTNAQEGEILMKWEPSGRVYAARVVSFPGDREPDILEQALMDAGYTPIPNKAPEYVMPAWLKQALKDRGIDNPT